MPHTRHMTAYLQSCGLYVGSLTPQEVEATYYRHIYKVERRQDIVDASGQPKKTINFRNTVNHT